MTNVQENPFGKGVGYVRITNASLMQDAQNPNFPRWERVRFAALARVNRDGHAEFGMNELRGILGGTKRTPAGVAVPDLASAQTVTDAIRLAKEKGVIAEESCSRCLVIPGNGKSVSQGRGRTGCGWHGIMPRQRTNVQ